MRALFTETIRTTEYVLLWVFTSNYHHTASKLYCKWMSLVVSSIVGVSMNIIVLWISVRVDDWTAERVIIASNP